MKKPIQYIQLKKMSKQKTLYKVFSVYQILSDFIWRVITSALFIYSILNFNENPIVVTIVVSFCLLFILIIGDEEIEVNQDRIIQRHRSVLNWLKVSKNKNITIQNTIFASLEKPAENFRSDFVMMAILSFALPVKRLIKENKISVLFHQKDGRILVLKTSLPTEKIEKLIETVNRLTKE